MTVGIALVQMAIFLGLGAAAFGLTLTGAWWMGVPLLVVGTLCFMALGLLAGAITTTTEGAVNVANFMVLPMAFLSGSFFPLDGAPPWLQRISLAAAPAPPQRRDARRHGPRRAVDRRAGADGDPRGFAVVVTLRRGPAVPLGDRLMGRLLLQHAALALAPAAAPGRPSPLAGRTVLVTGASSGIGEATALAAARRGARVLLVARRAEELARVRAAIEARGGRGGVVPLRPDRRRRGRRPGRAGAGRARGGRLPGQQRRPVDPPLAAT